METKRCASINFGANLQNTVKIRKLAKDGKYYHVPASFIKINCNSKLDVDVLGYISRYWQGSLYTDNIYNKALSKLKKYESLRLSDIYALTLQKDKFEKLDPEKILGVTDICENVYDKGIFIEHLQANPEYIYDKNREYKDIGSSILTSLKILYESIELVARKSMSVTNFYKKNGFKEENKTIGFFTWTKD